MFTYTHTHTHTYNSWVYFEEYYYGVENATGFFESLDLGTPASSLTFSDLNNKCGRSIIIFVLCSVYCSIDSAVQDELRNVPSSLEEKTKKKKQTVLNRCEGYFKEIFAYTAEFVCTILISVLSIGEVHGVAVILLFTSLLWVMTPRTEIKTAASEIPKNVPITLKGIMYRFSAILGTVLVCAQSLTKLEVVGEHFCPVVNQTNRMNHSGIFGTYMCSKQVYHETFNGWSCPTDLNTWRREGPQIQFSETCYNAMEDHSTEIDRNATIYTDLDATEYCILMEYRMFCSIYPTSSRSPTVNDLEVKDRLETSILTVFLLCCALLSTTEHWRYRLEVIFSFFCRLTYLFALSLIYLLTYSLTHFLTYSLSHSLTTLQIPICKPIHKQTHKTNKTD